jgi:pyruvate kinase
MRRTRIVATLGPATDPPDVLASILAAGVDIVRLNGAHSDETSLSNRVRAVRSAAELVGREVGILLDLPGPKMRLGEVLEGSELEPGHRFVLDVSPEAGDAARAGVNHPGFADDVGPGDRVLVDDGRIELRVLDVRAGEVTCGVVVGGVLTGRKGVSVPGVTLSVDAITQRDRELAEWVSGADVDWVGQSFVRCAEDVDRLREALPSGMPIVAKIEKHEAIGHLREIIEAADAVMVARGDLAVETAPEQVPVLQRRIVTIARGAGRPVIVATEMLDSMRERPTPTRAEASDVATAIFGRADAVMLSGETAVGLYPVRSVETMARIIQAAEDAASPPRPPKATGVRDVVQAAVSAAVSDLAVELDVAAIVTLTQSGSTALAVSRHRPAVPIIAAVPDTRVARRLSLVWGVRTVVTPFLSETGALLDAAVEAVSGAGLVRQGERIALTAGLASRSPGGTDFIHVRVV